MHRVIVCGGRSFWVQGFVRQCLNRWHDCHGIDLLIHGGDNGADMLAAQWARWSGITSICVPAHQHNYRLAASRMIREWSPHAVIAFTGGIGTADMVHRAHDAGIPVWRPHIHERPVDPR